MMWLLASPLMWMVGMVAANLSEFPNPQNEFRLCGRRESSFVCDPEFVLDISDVDRLDRMAREFRRSTACLCSGCETGISVGIFVRRNLTQESLKQHQSGKNIAEVIRKRWQLGKCNDDVVIILLASLNISEYSMGSAVQEIIPRETADLIMNDCRIHFLSGWYYQGLESVVNSFSDVLKKIQKRRIVLSKNLIIGISLGLGVMLILVIFGIVLLRRQNKRRKQGCEDIYESVPNGNRCNKYLNEKINEYQLDKLHKQNGNDDDDEEGYSDEDINLNIPSRQLLGIKRQLSAVAEESSDDNETFKDKDGVCLTNSRQKRDRSLQVTEL